MRSTKRRPSPALVVAFLALSVAIVGTATAGPGALTKREKKQVRKLANKRISKAAPNLSVAKAGTAVVATSAELANRAFAADSATSASNAVTAGNAATAGNAGAVDGHSAACPGGMSAIAGLCYDSSNRGADDWPAAQSDCADEGRSLPTVGQLTLAIGALGNVQAGNGEWTDSFYTDDDGSSITNRALGLNNAGTVTSLNIATNVPYRCVTPLVR
ncbi:MAG: hypothetical protein ACRDL6_01930 [Solirubrobacterales bacterium]